MSILRPPSRSTPRATPRTTLPRLWYGAILALPLALPLTITLAAPLPGLAATPATPDKLVRGGSAQALLFAQETRDVAEALATARRIGKPLVIAFTQADCPGCREMEQGAWRDPATRRTYAGCLTLRVDLGRTEPLRTPSGQGETPGNWAQSLGVLGTPSFVFFDAHGRVRYRFTGPLGPGDFRLLARYVAKKVYDRAPFQVFREEATLARLGHPPRLNASPVVGPLAEIAANPDFSLPDTRGKRRHLADFRGQVVALAVGYTQCPDVCPTTLSEMLGAIEALPPQLRQRVQGIFATLDPARDQAALLEEYLSAFTPRGGRPFLGLRGDDGDTAAFIRRFALVAERQPSSSLGYTLDHTAGIFLIDGRGRLRGLFPYGDPSPEGNNRLTADLARLAREIGS